MLSARFLTAGVVLAGPAAVLRAGRLPGVGFFFFFGVDFPAAGMRLTFLLYVEYFFDLGRRP